MNKICTLFSIKYPIIQGGIDYANSFRRMNWEPNDPVDNTNRNRGIDSFTDTECWNFFRHRKDDLRRLITCLEFPEVMLVDGPKNGSVLGEYAALIMTS